MFGHDIKDVLRQIILALDLVEYECIADHHHEDWDSRVGGDLESNIYPEEVVQKHHLCQKLTNNNSHRLPLSLAPCSRSPQKNMQSRPSWPELS